MQINVIARRGIAQSAFTIKEIREFKNINIDLCVLRE
jgi:hypothetical protein